MKRSFRGLVEVFARNWSSVVFSNALFTLFCLPFAVWIVICQCYSSLLIKFESPLDSWYIVTFAGLLPTMLILFLGLAGSVYSHKKIFWDENGEAVKTFFGGIKRDWNRYLLYGFLCWLSITTAIAGTTFYIESVSDPIISGIAAALSILQAFIVFPIVFCNMAQGAFYEEKLKNIFGNSFKILLMKPSMVLYAAIAVAPLAIIVILPLIWQLSGWVLFMIVLITPIIVFVLQKCGVIFENIVNNNSEKSETESEIKEEKGEEL